MVQETVLPQEDPRFLALHSRVVAGLNKAPEVGEGVIPLLFPLRKPNARGLALLALLEKVRGLKDCPRKVSVIRTLTQSLTALGVVPPASPAPTVSPAARSAVRPSRPVPGRTHTLARQSGPMGFVIVTPMRAYSVRPIQSGLMSPEELAAAVKGLKPTTRKAPLPPGTLESLGEGVFVSAEPNRMDPNYAYLKSIKDSQLARLAYKEELLIEMGEKTASYAGRLFAQFPAGFSLVTVDREHQGEAVSRFLAERKERKVIEKLGAEEGSAVLAAQDRAREEALVWAQGVWSSFGLTKHGRTGEKVSFAELVRRSGVPAVSYTPEAEEAFMRLTGVLVYLAKFSDTFRDRLTAQGTYRETLDARADAEAYLLLMADTLGAPGTGSVPLVQDQFLKKGSLHSVDLSRYAASAWSQLTDELMELLLNSTALRTIHHDLVQHFNGKPTLASEYLIPHFNLIMLMLVFQRITRRGELTVVGTQAYQLLTKVNDFILSTRNLENTGPGATADYERQVAELVVAISQLVMANLKIFKGGRLYNHVLLIESGLQPTKFKPDTKFQAVDTGLFEKAHLLLHNSDPSVSLQQKELQLEHLLTDAMQNFLTEKIIEQTGDDVGFGEDLKAIRRFREDIERLIKKTARRYLAKVRNPQHRGLEQLSIDFASINQALANRTPLTTHHKEALNAAIMLCMGSVLIAKNASAHLFSTFIKASGEVPRANITQSMGKTI